MPSFQELSNIRTHHGCFPKSFPKYSQQLFLNYTSLNDIVGRGFPIPPIFIKTPLYCVPFFFKFCLNLLPRLLASNLNPYPFLCCLVSLAEWVIAPCLMRYFTYRYIYIYFSVNVSVAITRVASQRRHIIILL